MQQTLLALLALLLITSLNFSQQQASLRSQQQAIRAEYRQMALGVAKQSLEAVRARRFDQALAAGEEEVEEFTPETSSSWGGKDCINNHRFVNACSAIEHFHDDASRSMDGADGTLQVRIPDHVVDFQVEMEVHYAEDRVTKIVRADAGEKTRLKEVTVRVQDCQDGEASNGDPCDGEPLLHQPITFTEVFGYTDR